MSLRAKTTEILDSPKWAEVAEKTKGIIAPAHVLTLGGMFMTIKGARNMGTLKGTVQFGVGRLLDLGDGWLARRTNTATRTGEFADAAADKVATAALVLGAHENRIMPSGVNEFIAAQNAANVGLSLIGQVRGAELHSSRYGKWNTAAQAIAFGAYSTERLLNNMGYEDGADRARLVGHASVAAIIVMGSTATGGYTLDALAGPAQQLPAEA